MKRYIKSREPIIKEINIVAYVEIPEGCKVSGEDVAASTIRGFKIPDGDLLPAEKGALINSQALADYHAFVESVENLLTQYYDLELYYKNESEYNSFYFGLLAKNEDESFILDFTFNLRISDHERIRSKQSQKEKKKQEDQMLALTHGKKPRPITKTVVVNDEEFDNYDDAYFRVDSIVQGVLKIMTRRKK